MYNIIYYSQDGEVYLWNGSSFDKLGKKENKGLFYSGKSFNEDEIADAIDKSRKTVQHQFPKDSNPRIEKEKVPINDGDTEGGHHHHMTS